MTQSLANISAQKIKLSVYELNSLLAHPLCAVKCAGFVSADLYENASACLSSDPAIALAVIRFAERQNLKIDLRNADFPSLLKQLSKKDLLRFLLTLKTHNPENDEILRLSSSLIRQTGTRTFAAQLITEKADEAEKGDVFLAALFADAGLFALAQLFTKSLLMLRQESAEQNTPLFISEQEHLGVTDNILSKMLLQKWQLPEQTADAAWLFKTKADALIDKMPNAKVISIVRLAELLCEQNPDDAQNLTRKLSLKDSDLNEIKGKVEIFAGQINGLLGLDEENPAALYSETIKQIYMNQLSQKPYTGNEFEAFVGKFCENINSQARLADLVSVSAKIIYEIFSPQNCCVFIALQNQPNVFLTAVINGSGNVKQTLIESSENIEADDFRREFCKKAGIEIEDKQQFTSIKDDDGIIGWIITGPIFDVKQLELISGFLAKMASIINKSEYQESIAQMSVESLGQTKTQESSPQAITAGQDLSKEMVAEIAAGAAHELNNPLAVISGRAQLLSQRETDETKKTVLNQISEKAKDAHEIVGQLMSYARPPKPQIRTVSPFIVINNSLEKVSARYLSEPLEIKLENIENLGDVDIDAEQAAESIAQIIFNSLESYESGNGPVEISGKEESDSIEIKISDSGGGMSAETLEKAAQPFFSDKPAGRQRGMGLALADSFLKNNGCTLKIESVPEKGTIVSIRMPMPVKAQ